VVPRREVIIEQPAYVAPRYVTPRDSFVTPRDSFAYRGTVRSGSGIVTTGYSCVIDMNGFERCY
jgi:hypothetical protein